MGYQWPVDIADIFVERSPQMVNTGMSEADVKAMRSAIKNMWPDEPGGWVYEWSKLAKYYADESRHDLALLAYGWAKYPSLADESKRKAFKHQLEQYKLASSGFPVSFERQHLDVSYESETHQLAVHKLFAPETPKDAPVIIASGGVDSWKMDLHQIFSQLAIFTKARVILFDIPGTGETEIPLGYESLQILDGLIDAARDMGNGKVAHLGISMGGYFSAFSGLTKKVDGSVVIGGPVAASYKPNRNWQFGMADILGNALGFDNKPTDEALSTRRANMSLQALLDQDDNAPMLVINGADDVHVPQSDTLVFEGRKDTTVMLLPDAGHCAPSKFPEMMGAMVPWLGQILS